MIVTISYEDQINVALKTYYRYLSLGKSYSTVLCITLRSLEHENYFLKYFMSLARHESIEFVLDNQTHPPRLYVKLYT